MAGKKIDHTVREKIVETYDKGVPRKKIAEQFGVSVSSVGRIIRAREGRDGRPGSGANDETAKKIAEIERRIAELEQKIMEREARRKGSCGRV